MDEMHQIANFLNVNLYMNHEKSDGKPLVYIKFHDEKALYNFKEDTFLKSNLRKTPEELVRDFCNEKHDELMFNIVNKEYNWINE